MTRPRHLYDKMARSLVRAYRYGKTIGFDKWFHFSDLRLDTHNEFEKLAHWRLLESPDTSAEGRRGLWRITTRGIAFVECKIRVPKTVLIRLGVVVGFDGPKIGIKTALGTKFNYDAIMRGDA